LYVHFRYDSAGSNFAAASALAAAAAASSYAAAVTKSVYFAIYCATFVIIIAMPQLKAPRRLGENV